MQMVSIPRNDSSRCYSSHALRQLVCYVTNCRPNCAKQIPARELDQHQRRCPHRLLQCNHSGCRVRVPRRWKRDHEDRCDYCPKKVHAIIAISQPLYHHNCYCSNYSPPPAVYPHLWNHSLLPSPLLLLCLMLYVSPDSSIFSVNFQCLAVDFKVNYA